jgi:hypothetical protein
MKDINCKKCGISINETSRFCYSCGTPKEKMSNFSKKPITKKTMFKDSRKFSLIIAMIGCFAIFALILNMLLQDKIGMEGNDSKTYKEINEKIIILESTKLEQLKLVTNIQTNLNTEQAKLTGIKSELQKLIDQKNEIEKKYNAFNNELIPKVEAKEKEIISLNTDKIQLKVAEQSAPLVNRKENMIKYLQKNAHKDIKNSIEIWLKFEDKHKIKAEVAICIAQADSSLGRALKTKYNLGNVGNTDSGKIRKYDSWESGIEAIFKVLNNDALGQKQTIGSLSRGGGGKGAIYASSPINWNRNVKACLSTILQENIKEGYLIRKSS